MRLRSSQAVKILRFVIVREICAVTVAADDVEVTALALLDGVSAVLPVNRASAFHSVLDFIQRLICSSFGVHGHSV